MSDKSQLTKQWHELYRKTLLEDVLPFWMKYGFDKEHGGIGNILDDAGNVLGHDKYIWSQGRGLWTFSALCKRVEKRPEWLAFADHIYEYLSSHGRDGEGRWMFRLDGEGNVLDRDISIYADSFALNGMAEYYSAGGNRNALKIALETYESTWSRVNRPGSYGLAPYAVPAGMKPFGIPMVFSFFYYWLGKIAERPDICEVGHKLAHVLMKDFYVPEKDAMLELVTTEGRFVDSVEGRTCTPGHVLEALWFLISIFEQTGESDRIQTCCRLIKRHLELGWDEEFGGLVLGIDIDGKTEGSFWQNPDRKPWWVQTEALVATAYAYRHTKEDWCLEWHKRIQDYAYSHYPVKTGEWIQWLDRRGRKMEGGTLPVKDPFHLPRTLIYLLDLFAP